MQGNDGPIESSAVIKKMGYHNVPIRLAKAISFCGTSYEGEVQPINLGIDVSLTNINQASSLLIY